MSVTNTNLENLMLIYATVRVEPKYREPDGGIIRCNIDPVVSRLVLPNHQAAAVVDQRGDHGRAVGQ